MTLIRQVKFSVYIVMHKRVRNHNAKAFALFLSPNQLLGLCLETRFLLNPCAFCFQWYCRISWPEYVLCAVINQVIYLRMESSEIGCQTLRLLPFALWVQSPPQQFVILKTMKTKLPNLVVYLRDVEYKDGTGEGLTQEISWSLEKESPVLMDRMS